MKRTVALITALAGLAASVRLGLRRAEDARNVSRLGARYGLGEQEAKALYETARTHGFGYAAQRLLRDRQPASERDKTKVG
jgi:hypothetical protein